MRNFTVVPHDEYMRQLRERRTEIDRRATFLEAEKRAEGLVKGQTDGYEKGRAMRHTGERAALVAQLTTAGTLRDIPLDFVANLLGVSAQEIQEALEVGE